MKIVTNLCVLALMLINVQLFSSQNPQRFAEADRAVLSFREDLEREAIEKLEDKLFAANLKLHLQIYEDEHIKPMLRKTVEYVLGLSSKRDNKTN